MEGILDYYLKNRLKSLGIDEHQFDFHKEVVPSNDYVVISSTNDLYYLYDVSPIGSFQVESDTDIVTDAEFYTDSAPYRVFELKGDIIIRNNSDENMSFTFFKIIPKLD